MTQERHTNIPASYIIFKQENQILMLRRANTGYEDGNYSLVAGHVDPGESFSKTAAREALEEAGVFVFQDDLSIAHIMHRKWTDGDERVDVFFIADAWEGDITNLEPEKCDDLSWFDINALPDNTIDYVKVALGHILDGVWYSEIGWE